LIVDLKMSSSRHILKIEPLEASAFAPFGDIIEANDTAKNFAINAGFAQRYQDLAKVDVSAAGGYPMISIFKAKPRSLPLSLRMLERHPLGSQAFMSLSAQSFLVVVAHADGPPQINQIRCFQTAAGQGVNYARGTWHHPLIALTSGDFLVIDRGGAPSDLNCDEYPLPDGLVWIE
jgi:ureidoglycolate lyase